VSTGKFIAARRQVLAAGAAAAVTSLIPGRARAKSAALRVINPTRSSSSWPIWIAKEAGLFQKYGFDVTPQFGVHPVGIAGLVSGEIQFTNYSLDDVAAAAVRDPILVVMGSILHRGAFAVMARKEITTIQGLKGKRFGVGRVGDPPYHYTSGLLRSYGLRPNDVQWVPTGTDAAARVTMLLTGQLDASLITSPAWYRLEQQGLAPLALLEEHESVVITAGYTFRKSWVASNPDAPERLLRALGEAVHRLYLDKPTAVAAYRKYDPSASEGDTERLYDNVKRSLLVDRIPLVQKTAPTAVVERIGPDISAVRTFDFKQMIDNSVARKLVAEGFYEKLYGAEIKAEQDRKLSGAF
jgi:ABC-type nitrate/sulfonate/bicarbonate transport system substrate-binding protein